MRTMCFCEYVWVVMNSYTEEMKGKTNIGAVENGQ